MIIQKITIHNLASIEDAEIDFTSQPLASADVFLIAGKTGAGKSTILDAISLTLYGTTPRLENLEEKNTRITDGNNDITARDPRQLMRRGTGECAATLLFTGNDGTHYESTWTAARASKKTSGRLQTKKWFLRNLNNGALFDKDRDIEAEIARATGLSFSQFCRTTMLAQGDFQRFLNSKDDDKAEILEKITGTNIYAEIGRRLYETTSDKKNDYLAADKLVESVQLLSPDEIEEKKSQLDELGKQRKMIEEQNNLLTSKQQWIETEKKNDSLIDEARQNLQAAKEKAESNESIQQATLVKEWNETIDARQHLHQWNEANADITQIDNDRKTLQSTFVKAAGGLEHERSVLLKNEEEKLLTDAFILSQEPRLSVFERHQLLLSHIDTIAENEKQKKILEDRILQLNNSLNGTLKQQCDQADSKLSDLDNSLKGKNTLLSEKETELKNANLPELRQQHKKAIGILADIKVAESHLAAYNEEKERISKEESDLKQLESDIASKTARCKELQEEMASAAKLLEERRQSLEKMNDSVGDWARVARAKLHEGDLCPVCRHKIEAPLHVEEELQQLLNEAQKLYNEAYKSYTDKEKSFNSTDAQVKTQQQELQRRRLQLANNTTLKTKQTELDKLCLQLGIDSSQLPALRSKYSDVLAELGKKLDEGSKIEEEANALRTETKEISEKKEEARSEAEKARAAMDNCKNSIATARELVTQRSETIVNSSKEIDTILGNTAWNNDWRTSPEQFKAELLSAVRKYNSETTKQSTLALKINKLHSEITSTAGVLDDAREKLVFDEGTDLNSATTPVCVNDLPKVANALLADAAALQSRLYSAKTQKQISHTWLADFHKANPAITVERLQKLASFPLEEIEKTKNTIENLRLDVDKKQAVLNEYIELQKNHLATKPQLTDEDLDGHIVERIEENTEKIKELSSACGAIEAQLQTDSKNRQHHAALIADADSKRKIYERWKNLCDIFGDSTGKTFRTIAQSYVLTNLIHSANHYMRQLSDRYELMVEPGSFAIQVLDAYQSYESRSAATISGGEGFLVSLALALALSDVGNRLSANILFIDEGFGTLSGEPLQNAISTLKALHSHTGRHVGIISHIEELQERIPVQIQVLQESRNTHSSIVVKG